MSQPTKTAAIGLYKEHCSQRGPKAMFSYVVRNRFICTLTGSGNGGTFLSQQQSLQCFKITGFFVVRITDLCACDNGFHIDQRSQNHVDAFHDQGCKEQSRLNCAVTSTVSISLLSQEAGRKWLQSFSNYQKRCAKIQFAMDRSIKVFACSPYS